MKRILIVDDIEENLYLLRIQLEGNGYEVDEARNGNEAITQALAISPDLVISDILMPVMDGYSLCRIWKEDERLKHIPFIFYTATYTDPRDEQLALDMGADDFIVKPHEPEDFMSRIGTLMVSHDGKSSVAREPREQNETLLKNYNETLVRKLEQKMFEVEEINRTLEDKITEKNIVENSLRESEELFRNIFHQHAAIKLIIDPETGNIIDANQSAIDYYGWPREIFLGMKIQDINILPSDDTRGTLEIASLQQKFRLEFKHRRADGTIRDVEVFTSNIHAQGKTLLHSIVHDITDRKLAENELKKYRQDLEDIVRERTTQLKEANTELSKKIDELQVAKETLETARLEAETANKAKSKFLSNMSHEIRTPLNAILGFSTLLLREKGITQTQKDRLTTINKSGEHLLSLINDILELSKIEAGRASFKPAPFNLSMVMQDLESMFKIRAEEKNLELKFEIQKNLPETIITDEGKLRQILINLLGNAIKFTKEGGLSLRAHSGSTCGNRVNLIIEIEDTGSGMSSEDLQNLFKPFSQTETGAREGGTGLGLALSQQNANLMNGSIKVRSEAGKGSCFTLEIEVLKPEETVKNEIVKQQRITGIRSGQTSRVLIVDDNEDNRTLMRTFLAPVGFQIEEAVNGLDAIEKFKNWSPDIILMDMRMPVMNGYNAIIRIREIPGGESIPIIAVTASAFEEDREKTLNWGANGYLRKPFKGAELYECLKTFLGVEYEVEENNEVDTTSTEQSLLYSLKNIPDMVIDKMLDTALSLDRDSLLDTITGTPGIDVETVDLLTKIVKSYQYETLVKILKKRKEG